MKKQGELYLKLLSIGLGVLTLLFLLARLPWKQRDYSLCPVIYCEVGDGISVSGFVVREEQVLHGGGGNIRYLVPEGQRLSAGQCYGKTLCCMEEQIPVTSLCVSRGGYFSATVDGFETLLSPQSLERMSVREFGTLQSIALSPSRATGRLVQGQTWYFAAILPQSALVDIEVGELRSFRFDLPGQASVKLRLTHLSQVQEGCCIAVFSSDRFLGEVLSLRRISGVIEGELRKGLRVPKTALYHLEGETGVYVLVAQRAKWKKVNILADLGEEVLVEYCPNDLSCLRTEDELIITNQEIENGKVIT